MNVVPLKWYDLSQYKKTRPARHIAEAEDIFSIKPLAGIGPDLLEELQIHQKVDHY